MRLQPSERHSYDPLKPRKGRYGVNPETLNPKPLRQGPEDGRAGVECLAGFRVSNTKNPEKPKNFKSLQNPKSPKSPRNSKDLKTPNSSPKNDQQLQK